MSLYDGLGLDSKEKVQRDPKSDLVGWSSGIKLLQSQLQLKKAALTQAKMFPLSRNVVPCPSNRYRCCNGIRHGDMGRRSV
ncbi:hypothetical protein AVEN_36330-1 [Araneus ventricosus]|uniref:Uncharacterized protein n=1 Tax=Araneus ventricosus TaxID=182803 RepID=A0A4Y2VNR9_ARAVE|nr:hypothetical protein AVEN_36330-1 [Araneus ventricosus]